MTLQIRSLSSEVKELLETKAKLERALQEAKDTSKIRCGEGRGRKDGQKGVVEQKSRAGR